MKQILENLIKDWWARPLPRVIPRDVDLAEYLDLKVRKIISVIGFRRTGKTYTLLDLAQKVGQKNCIYINFEDERLPKETAVLTKLLDVLVEISGGKPYILLLDEIQNIPDWSLWARRVIETMPHKLFISGSSSRLSSRELPTELRGRSLTVKIEPLNFREFLRFKGVSFGDLPSAQVLHFTREYLTYGGFPEIAMVEEGKKPYILDEYFQTFLARDVIERHHLRNDQGVKALIQLLLNSPYYTISGLTNSLRGVDYKISKASVMRYLDFLGQSFFFKPLCLHTPSLKNRLKAAKKPYFVDSYFLSRYTTAFSQNLGRIMENLVACQLWKRIEDRPLSEIYYWKDYQNHEVDFVIRENEVVKKLIQVSWVSSRSEIAKRELEGLLKASRQFKTLEMLLISWDFKGEFKIDKTKIKCLPLYEWLMEENF